jgi:hypothetical protein
MDRDEPLTPSIVTGNNSSRVCRLSTSNALILRAGAHIAAYGFSFGWIGGPQAPRQHNFYHADQCTRRLVFLSCIATIRMLGSPSFIPASIEIRDIVAEFQDDGHATIHRSTDVVVNPSNKGNIKLLTWHNPSPRCIRRARRDTASLL